MRHYPYVTIRVLCLSCIVVTSCLRVQIVNAGVVHGIKIPISSLENNKPMILKPTHTQDAMGLVLAHDGDSNALHVEVIDEADEVIDAVPGVPDQLDISVCEGKGILHVVSGVIIPPRLHQRIQEYLGSDKSPCQGEDGGSAVGSTDDLLTGTNITLGSDTNTSTATIPVTATVDTTAIDANGNEVPVQSEVELDVNATLTEISDALGDTDVLVCSPSSHFLHALHRCIYVFHDLVEVFFLQIPLDCLLLNSTMINTSLLIAEGSCRWRYLSMW
jgi:hypothetical protein